MSLSILLNKDTIRKKCHPMCFYLKWTDEGQSHMPKYVAQWTNLEDLDKTKIKWKTTIKWKEIGDITLATDFLPDREYLNINENMYKNDKYLKSHLQKSIRRSNVSKSIKTAVHFYDINNQDMLRRLCIIAIEDALPIDGFSTLVWLMAANSKDYKISDSHLGWILGYVHDLAKCNYYEQIDHGLAQNKNISMKNLRLYQLDQTGRNLCYSIMFREVYGGMKNDRNMCLSAAMLWYMRFNTKSRFLKLLSREQNFITPPTVQLNKNEWFNAAIDFHCYPGICNYLWERHDQYDVELLKQVIWHCSSCITNKKNIASDMGQRCWDNQKYREIWKIIRKDFNSITKFMILQNS